MPSVLWGTWFDVSKTAGIYAPVGLFHWVFRDRFLAISLHEANKGRNFNGDRRMVEILPPFLIGCTEGAQKLLS
jgi:hypothetical protein